MVTEKKLSLRVAQVTDAAAVRKIYAPFVTSGAVSFEFEVPAEEEMARRIEQTLRQYPWLVLTEDDAVVGYAYAGRHRERAAYQWSVESSVYLDARIRRKGAGRRLYEALFRILTRQGYLNVYAGITLPNEASRGFHESMGFQPIGVYPKIGFKQGTWHDVGWWRLALGSYTNSPVAPRSFDGMDLALPLT